MLKRKTLTKKALFYTFISLYIFFYIISLNPSLLYFMGYNNPLYYQNHAPFFYTFSLMLFLVVYLIGFNEVSRINFSNKEIVLFLVLAMVLRVVSQVNEPMTTDLYRYLANGLNWSNGKNAYIDPPFLVKGLSFIEYRSMYPPGAELLFFLMAKLWPSIHVYKCLAGFFELAFLLLIYFQSLKKNRKYYFLFFLLNPVSIFEFHGEGHLDIIPIFFISLSIFTIYSPVGSFAIKKGKIVLAFILLSLGFLVKYQAALLWPFFVFQRVIKVRMKHLRDFILLFFQRFLIINWLVLFFIVVLVVLSSIPILFWQKDIALNSKIGSQMYFKYWVFQHPLTELLKWCNMSHVSAIKFSQISLLSTTILGSLLYALQRISFRQLYLFGAITFVLLFPVQHPWYSTILYPAVFFNWPRLPKITVLGPVFISLNYISYSFNTSLGSYMGWFFFCALLYLNKNSLKKRDKYLLRN